MNPASRSQLANLVLLLDIMPSICLYTGSRPLSAEGSRAPPSRASNTFKNPIPIPHPEQMGSEANKGGVSLGMPVITSDSCVIAGSEIMRRQSPFKSMISRLISMTNSFPSARCSQRRCSVRTVRPHQTLHTLNPDCKPWVCTPAAAGKRHKRDSHPAACEAGAAP